MRRRLDTNFTNFETVLVLNELMVGYYPVCFRNVWMAVAISLA